MSLLYFVLFSHWVADFVFQTKWMAESKGKSLKPLAAHILEYTMVLGLCLVCWSLISGGISLLGICLYVLTNGLLHFVTDFITSRITKFAYANFDKPWGNKLFWSTIGLDQFVHSLSLIATLPLL